MICEGHDPPAHHCKWPTLRTDKRAQLSIGCMGATQFAPKSRELLGERDLSMAEVTAVIGRGIGKPDLSYEQFPYDQVQQVLTQMGVPPKEPLYTSRCTKPSMPESSFRWSLVCRRTPHRRRLKTLCRMFL